jgi:hypothetical protein
MTRPYPQFRISFGANCPHEPFLVTATDYAEAAVKAAKKLFKGMHLRNVHRTTGDKDKSGWFRVYTSINALGGENSTGWPFHVAPV